MRVGFAVNDEIWTEEQNVQTFRSQTDRCGHHGTGESSGHSVYRALVVELENSNSVDNA